MVVQQEWFTVEEAAEYLRVSKRTIYRLCKEGHLVGYRTSNRGKATVAESSPVLKEGDILEANYSPEPIKVVATRGIGQRVQIFATGLNSRTSYDVTLFQQQVARSASQLSEAR